MFRRAAGAGLIGASVNAGIYMFFKFFTTHSWEEYEKSDFLLPLLVYAGIGAAIGTAAKLGKECFFDSPNNSEEKLLLDSNRVNPRYSSSV